MPRASRRRRPFVPLGWTKGACWLGCRRTGLDVQWIGPARFNGSQGIIDTKLFACADCIERMHNQAISELSTQH
ncbi:hypothetical protein PJ985_13985 [Streptomyces sp. ACA25]|uniref:hypothetical protein n=1 Tax=Streptomyces sp. ACA25 TaxID=3022596 RepID=UPI00230706FC|nr:hypothetical protein [Streptomyces sp. ACA25]MDB1088678.1 hypothetical protein [Streptomyces sp. ACA25]